MLDLRRDEFPEAFREVTAVIGMDAAAKLVEAFGGRKVYVPTSATEDGKLGQVIGLEALRRLSARWGRDQIQVPFLHAARIRRRDAEIRQRREAGASVTSLAEEFRISERHVFKICASK